MAGCKQMLEVHIATYCGERVKINFEGNCVNVRINVCTCIHIYMGIYGQYNYNI